VELPISPGIRDADRDRMQSTAFQLTCQCASLAFQASHDNIPELELCEGFWAEPVAPWCTALLYVPFTAALIVI
jgi:hypothetical protein